jgi:hypothetical protein
MLHSLVSQSIQQFINEEDTLMSLKSIYTMTWLAALMFVAIMGLPFMVAAEARSTVPQHPQADPGLVFVDYRHLDGGKDGVVLMNLDPESASFGTILQMREIGEGVLPHHLYFNRDGSRLYTTALGGANLYEIKLDNGADGLPRMGWIKGIDTGANRVGEDIYFTEDGSRYYVTFMGGQGGDQGGSVGVFDARTNELLESIQAPVPDELPADQPFILWPHGISANEELGLMMVTSTIHDDLQTGVGNTVTLIDMATNQPLKTYLVSEDWDILSSPVEVIMLRDGLPQVALVSTMIGGDIWMSEYDEESGLYGEFAKVLEGDDAGLAWPLEFYIYTNHLGQKELYISFAVPGVINVYALDDLSNGLVLKRQLPAGAGAHHMTFFETRSGREVVAVQNNLLNLDGLNSGLLTVVDIYTGAVLGIVDMPAEYGLMPESVESAFGHGHDYHH